MRKDTNQTAMQELIERLKRNIEEMQNEKNSFTQGYKAGLSFVIECATNSLKKEKEQIIESYRYGHIDGFTSANHLGTEYKNEEEYYNQTYNK